MRTSAVVFLLIAGTLLSQTASAQRGGRDNNAGGQAGGRGPGGPGGPGGAGGFGGPGGFGAMRGMMGGGGMMGRIGSSPAFLLNSEAVQKELKITEEQKEKLKKEQENQNEKRRKAFEDMRDQAKQKGGQDNQGGRGGRGGMDFNAMREMGEKMAKDAEAGINKILTADQRKRLSEISLQVEGPLALFENPDLSKKMNITQQQKNAYAKIKAQVDARQQEMRTQMAQVFGFGGGRGGQGGPGGPGQQGARGGQAGQPQQNGRGGQQAGGQQPGQAGGRPDPRNMSPEERTKMQEEARKGFEKMRDDSNKLRDQAEAAALKLLSKRQEGAYNKMIGEKFDVDSVMTSMQMQPQQGGRRGGPVD